MRAEVLNELEFRTARKVLTLCLHLPGELATKFKFFSNFFSRSLLKGCARAAVHRVIYNVNHNVNNAMNLILSAAVEGWPAKGDLNVKRFSFYQNHRSIDRAVQINAICVRSPRCAHIFIKPKFKSFHRTNPPRDKINESAFYE